jgi:hypothetical protein
MRTNLTRRAEMKPKTIRITQTCSVPPDRVLAAARDFSDRRPAIFPNVSTPLMTVHSQQQASADVAEGTRQGPLYAWERCDYDWSTPGSVRATVTESNVYAVPGSTWEITATAHDTGSTVDMIWVRRFQRKPLGLLLGTMYRVGGARLFRRDAELTLRNIEAAELAGVDSIPT